MSTDYQVRGPSREEIAAAEGPLVLEFGTAWCGHCQSAAPAFDAARADFPGVKHIQMEDGPGRPLGRSFGIKLWPTFIFLKEGIEIARVVRPTRADELRSALTKIA